MELGSIGVWSRALRRGERAAVVEACVELEALGYGAVWIPGGAHAGLHEHIESILAATSRVVVATGIVSIWTHPAPETAAMHHALTQAFPGRFLLGIGIAHRPGVEAAGMSYDRPQAKLASYLDELDAAPNPVPIGERILASLGPRSLKLARDRSSGTHPYFMPVEHTRIARAALGPGKIVAPEQMVVVESDPVRARGIARPAMDLYLHAPNYTSNLLRLGYSEADIANGGSDPLVDDIVAWGDADRIMQRVREQHAAGADHVCIQVLTEPPDDLPAAMDGLRQLAPALKK